jgi:hypothetical protein
VAIRYARWEPQSFGYRLPNFRAEARPRTGFRPAGENEQPREIEANSSRVWAF